MSFFHVFIGCANSVRDRDWLTSIRRGIDLRGGKWIPDAALNAIEREKALRKADTMILPITADVASYETELAFYEGAAIGMGVPLLRIAPPSVSKRDVPQWLQPYVVISRERAAALGDVTSSIRRRRRESKQSRVDAIQISRELHTLIARMPLPEAAIGA